MPNLPKFIESQMMKSQDKAQQTILSVERIFTIAEPFGEFRYGDAQGDKRIDFARAIEAEIAKYDRHALQIDGLHPSPCARFCEANAFYHDLKKDVKLINKLLTIIENSSIDKSEFLNVINEAKARIYEGKQYD